jgi:alpha-tubulin suppressor-like RCC1 family protein
VPGLTDAVEIQAGATHTCARRRNGEVLCWGSNSTGELGDGTKVERLSPIKVRGLY